MSIQPGNPTQCTLTRAATSFILSGEFLSAREGSLFVGEMTDVQTTETDKTVDSRKRREGGS